VRVTHIKIVIALFAVLMRESVIYCAVRRRRYLCFFPSLSFANNLHPLRICAPTLQYTV
jgi:hypothetical protein